MPLACMYTPSISDATKSVYGGPGVKLAVATVVACLITLLLLHTSQHDSFLSHEFCNTSIACMSSVMASIKGVQAFSSHFVFQVTRAVATVVACLKKRVTAWEQKVNGVWLHMFLHPIHNTLSQTHTYMSLARTGTSMTSSTVA